MLLKFNYLFFRFNLGESSFDCNLVSPTLLFTVVILKLFSLYHNFITQDKLVDLWHAALVNPRSKFISDIFPIGSVYVQLAVDHCLQAGMG